jgi:glycine cleavage system P protein (glycine dehydrogenase)
MAAMYAIYHGPAGIKAIATKVHFFTRVLADQVKKLGYTVTNENSFFDTLTIRANNVSALHPAASIFRINFRQVDDEHVGVTLDESVSPDDLIDIINVFVAVLGKQHITLSSILNQYSANGTSTQYSFSPSFVRESKYLEHPVFNAHHSETEMLRYIHHLQSKDLSLVHGMIPLGSCTMKLNSTASMIPVTYPGFSKIHPFAPIEQAQGYRTLIKVKSTASAIVPGCSPRDTGVRTGFVYNHWFPQLFIAT